MAFFALLWKARNIENYRANYEKEKINSIVLGNAQLEQTLSQRWRHYRFDTKKRISRIFKKLYPEGSVVSNFFLYLMTDQTFPNFLLKSVMGFVGGIVLTYLCFMFFVFQLAISLIHATIMSSIIGVLLTLGLAFSYRIRCLVFLLIPQFFSRVGRYTLTCYALVLILTGPATNTLKNSEVLSESMACSQEQIKTSVHQLNDLMKKPINAMKDSLKLMVDQLKIITAKVKETVIRLDRLVLSIVNTIQSNFSWLQSLTDICNAKLGTPYDRCCNAIQDGFAHCQKTLGPKGSVLCNVAYVAQAACYSVKPFKEFCYATDFMDEAILASVKKKLRNFSQHLRAMFHVEVHIHHSYSYSSNSSRSASQVAAGIVTEIRNRADPLLTWLSWSSCVTSLFLLLIIFRAKYYQHMYETRSRFDNRYVTKELQELDLKRQQQGRETVLPLNRRERAKYITTSSFRLVASEKVYLNRSAVFMAITTFKLLIHMVADYSLYWVLMTIRYHGRFQSDLMPGIPRSGAHVSGSGFVASLFSAIVGILDIPLSFPAPSPISCLPDPYPPDLRRYMQIGVLIFLLWFFALFEPYGLRLRHLIMGHYRPERAKARATWLYNHILRTRGSFMKFARRKLHREYKYTSEASLTFSQWITDRVPFQCFRTLIGLGPSQQHCLLCGITSSNNPDSRLTKCRTTGCPGIFCSNCFTDIGELCTICLSPEDYGDLSDVSLEKGSSDDSDSEAELSEGGKNEHITLHSTIESDRTIKSTGSKDENRRWSFFTKTTAPRGPLDTIALLHTGTSKNTTYFTTFFQKRFRNLKRNIKKRCRVKKQTVDWVAELTRDIMFNVQEENHNYYSNCHDIEEYGELDEVIHRRKSIGVNTDKNRGVLLNMLVNSFTRRRFKQSRIKQKKTNPELKLCKKLPIRRKKVHSIGKSSKGTLFSIKSFHAHHSTIRQRNLNNIIRSKKDSRTKVRRKGCEELKGVMKLISHFLKSNEIKNMSNKNNDNAPNNTLNEINKKITKASNNANVGEKKNKKKFPKGNKPKRPRKQKDANKIKTKTSRHRIAEFHKFFSYHWNNFKCSIMPGNANRLYIPIHKKKRNHKRRKKLKFGTDLNETEFEECFDKKAIKHTRNLRISAFLAELEWTKRDYRKDKDIDEGDDSFIHAHRTPASNKTVSMVQLKSFPFQWRGDPENELNCSRDKKCLYAKKQSAMRLFVPLSRQKFYAKKGLDRNRTKVDTVPESPSSSLVQRMMSSVSVVRGDSTFNRESSISISKRASVYRTSSEELNKYSDILDPAMLFKNAKYSDIMQVPSEEAQSHLSTESSDIASFLGKQIEHKGVQITIKPRMTSRSSQAANCATYCDREQQYETEEATAPKTSDPTSEEIEPETVKGVGSVKCPRDESVQMIPHDVCTCATQHCISRIPNMRPRQMNPMVVAEIPPANPVVNKKTQHTGTKAADKVTHCTARNHYMKDVKTGVSAVNDKLSLESSLLFNGGINIAKALNGELTDCTITDTSSSSISLRSNESKTDTTICSLATINYDDTPRRRKYRLKLVTKQNQSTLTENALVRDTGTITDDWWSPLIERKANTPILLEKKRGLNLVEKQKKELRELKEWKELRDVRKRRRTSGVMAGGRNVTFRSRTQIIPTAPFPAVMDIMSPSRYLLESQKYYNELFAYNYHPRLPQAAYNYVTHIPKYHEKDKIRSPVGIRRNHLRKTKRLDECYSLGRQLSPRKCKTESSRTLDSPRRKTSHRHERQSKNRHNAKNNSPPKRVYI